MCDKCVLEVTDNVRQLLKQTESILETRVESKLHFLFDRVQVEWLVLHLLYVNDVLLWEDQIDQFGLRAGLCDDQAEGSLLLSVAACLLNHIEYLALLSITVLHHGEKTGSEPWTFTLCLGGHYIYLCLAIDH